MKNKELLFIGPVSQKRNIIGGATIKNRNLIEYLQNNKIKVKILDTDNWRKNIFLMLFKLYYFLLIRREKKIILSTSAEGTYYFLRFLYIFNWRRKNIYFFQVGGKTSELLINKKYNIKYFKNITKIYVETSRMENMLRNIGLTQVKKVSNFKNFSINNKNKKKILLPLKMVFLSRIEKKKGIDLIFRMLSKINQNKIKITVDFYGPIKREEELEFKNKIAQYKETKYLGILNLMSERGYAKLSEYDLMLFPTCYQNEGIPGSVIDSLICGVPIIASRWKNYDQILNDKVAYNFELNNQIELNNLISKILDNDLDKILEMKKNCYTEAKKYHINFVLNEVIDEIFNE